MRVVRRILELETRQRSEMVDVTRELQVIADEENVDEGRMTVYIPHTTAGITINENADPDVAADMLEHLDRMIPWKGGWRHGEGNSAAHIKATLVGNSATLSVEGGMLRLGTWQGVFFCEFDGPRRRKVWVACELY